MRDHITTNYRHDSEDGRKEFAANLMKRLNLVAEKMKRNERMNEDIKRIDKRTQFSARDAVISVGRSDSAYDLAEEDEDLDEYVKKKINPDDSTKASPSFHSPRGNSFKNRRRSPSKKIEKISKKTKINFFS